MSLALPLKELSCSVCDVMLNAEYPRSLDSS